MKTIIDTAAGAGNFTTLLRALKASAFIDTLRTPGPYTLFAPSDEAFGRLTPHALTALLRDVKKLKMILAYHVISGSLASTALKTGSIRSIEGSALAIVVKGAAITVNGAKVVGRDIAASNGLIHVIDAPLLVRGAPLSAVA
jgi:uncharacterized surface protein with fasciclin (FAS1) repeats